MTTDEMIAWYESRSNDCNGNGIVDSVDIARGYVEDVNRNGAIDNCGTDTVTVSQVIRSGAWRRTASSRDSSFFSAVFSIDQTVRILYTVPTGGAHVRLQLTGVAAGDTVLVDRFQMTGAYELLWTRGNEPRREPHEHSFVLTVGSRRYVRRMAWT